MKRMMEDLDSPSELLQLMGITEDYQDPANVQADWQKVASRLRSHPHEARIMHPGGISYPLNLALCNSVTPAPASIIQKFVNCYPEAASLENFGNACRYPHTTGEVLKILLEQHRGRPSKELIKRWDLDWIACNNNRDAASTLIRNYDAAQPSTYKEWKEMRPSSHTFWFTLLMEQKSHVVRENNIKNERILQYFILQGNYANVELILDTYPTLLSETSWRASKKNQLPIHTALSSTSATEYRAWVNRSPIVKLLLQRGLDQNIGGDNGCGGLYAKDSHGDAMTYAINAGLHSKWEDPERKLCLEVCLQFAHANMYGRSSNEVDFDMPMLHAAIAVVPIHIFSTILYKYGITTLDKDKKGRTALFHLIKLMTDRPSNGYTTTNKVMASKRREREREMADRNFVLARTRFGDGFDHLLHHQGRQSLELMANRLWDREQEVLGGADLDLLRQNRQVEENNGNARLPEVLQRLVSALGERDRNVVDIIDFREDAVNGRMGRFERMLALPQVRPQNQNGQGEDQVQPAGQQDQANDVLPRLIPFIFQPIRPLLENNSEPVPVNDDNNDEPVPANNDDNNNAESAPTNNESNPEVQEVDLFADANEDREADVINEHTGMARRDMLRWGRRGRFFPRRNLIRRRVPRLAEPREPGLPAHIQHIDDEETQIVAHENDDITLRDMFEARDRELDKLQESMIEKRYFGDIRKILLKDAQSPQKTVTNCAMLRDIQNRLPIHYAAERGLFCEAFQDILKANPEAVCEADGLTKLYPFALAVSKGGENTQNKIVSLDVAFNLLLQNPSVMDEIIPR